MLQSLLTTVPLISEYRKKLTEKVESYDFHKIWINMKLTWTWAKMCNSLTTILVQMKMATGELYGTDARHSFGILVYAIANWWDELEHILQMKIEIIVFMYIFIRLALF